MNINDSLPKITSIAILLIAAFFFNVFASFLITPYLTSILTASDYAQYSTNVSGATIINLSLSYILNIILALWTYNQANKQKETPLTWTALTLFFGLTALILFYLFLLIKEIKILNQNFNK